MKTMNSLTQRQMLERKYNSARGNLLLVLAFTAINILLLVSQSNTYFLFSAYIPYALVSIGMLLCGKYPEEYYGENYSQMAFHGDNVFCVLLMIALVIILLYLLAWIFSKKNRVGWIIFSSVLFILDTVGMLIFAGIGTESIVDIIFHIWVIISLIQGIVAYYKLKKLPQKHTMNFDVERVRENEEIQEDTLVLRIVEPGVKARILLEINVLGHDIIYRRVKKVNELIIDNYVYDEYEAIIEGPHLLEARIDGHLVEASFDGRAHSYIKVDGQIVAKKLRLY